VHRCLSEEQLWEAAPLSPGRPRPTPHLVKVRVGEGVGHPPSNRPVSAMVNQLLLLYLLLLLPFSSCMDQQNTLQLTSLCEGGGGRVVLGPSPALLSFTGTSGLGTCRLQLTPHAGGLGLSLFTQKLVLQESPRCSDDFIQFGKTFLFFAQTKSPKFCTNVDLPDNKTSPVRLVPSPREWVERDAGYIHLWLSISQSLQNKQVQILATPFRVKCGSTERHWVHCQGTDACIRRSEFCVSSVACGGREERCHTRTTLSSVPGGPLDSSGFPLSLLLIAALVLVFSFLFCGLFLRIGLQYLVRKKDELTRRDEDRGGGDETETLDDSAPSAPPLPTNSFCAPLPPPPTYSEAVASSPPPPKLSSQHPLHVQPPPYSLLIGPSGPCLARSYTANNS